MVSKAKTALDTKRNTLAVAATGSGKTIMLSALSSKVGGKTLILQHRDELVAQNCQKFQMINPKLETSIFDGKSKDISGQATFAMVQSLSRRLAAIPYLDHLIVDEAHHSTSKTYLAIINAAKEKNPGLLLSGWTATPTRADGFGLKRAGFNNCCEEIGIKELVDLGYLVPPKAYRCTLDGVDLSEVRKTFSGEYDMDEVEEIMDVAVHNRTIVNKWREYAGDRQTIVFCSTVEHATHVTEEFASQGVKVALLTGSTSETARRAMLAAFDKGTIQVICNVAVLTEGYDCQTVSCIVLLRPCSFKSTMLQMVGRGLRTVDPELYPGVEKTDCVVLDFGATLETHEDLYVKPMLDDREKECPECGSMVQPGTSICQICGHVWEPPEKRKAGGDKDDEELVTEVEMVEIDILRQSPFKWVDLFGSGKAMIAKGFEAMVGIFSVDGDRFVAIGKVGKEKGIRVLQKGRKPQCLSKADDFLRLNETDDAAAKTKRWLREPATDKQWALLERAGYSRNIYGNVFTKYTANAHLNFRWNQWRIEKAMGL